MTAEPVDAGGLELISNLALQLGPHLGDFWFSPREDIDRCRELIAQLFHIETASLGLVKRETPARIGGVDRRVRRARRVQYHA
jgi:hypothetical protein